MLPLKFAGRWRLAGIALLLGVLAATLSPAVWLWPDRLQLVSWLDAYDKWAHAATFFILAVWFSGQYRPRSYWRIAVGLLLFGVLIEGLQGLVGYRTASWLDLAADVAGILIGLTIAATGLGGWSLKVEDWLGRRSN
ncbi:MAG: VanZ family protein [Woeseiaceae bacterium]|nr:VanZ family protein [Woeseiaceae bacterium]